VWHYAFTKAQSDSLEAVRVFMFFFMFFVFY